jgi:hypothetical protein
VNKKDINANDKVLEEKLNSTSTGKKGMRTACWSRCSSIKNLTSLLDKPFFAFLDVFIEQLRKITDDEGEDDTGEELREPFQFQFSRMPHIHGERAVGWCNWMR